MTHPEYIYWILLAFVVLPMAGCSRVAGVILGVFGVAGLAVIMGISLVPAYLCAHSIGLLIGMGSARRTNDIAASSLFLSLAAVDVCRIGDVIDDSQWWWGVYGIALAQVLALVTPNHCYAAMHSVRGFVVAVRKTWLLRFAMPVQVSV